MACQWLAHTWPDPNDMAKSLKAELVLETYPTEGKAEPATGPVTCFKKKNQQANSEGYKQNSEDHKIQNIQNSI